MLGEGAASQQRDGYSFEETRHDRVHAAGNGRCCFRLGRQPSSHSQVQNIELRQHHAHRPSESSDMLLYLAGVNEHAVLRIVGSKRWSVAHFLRTIQYLFEYGGRFLAT